MNETITKFKHIITQKEIYHDQLEEVVECLCNQYEQGSYAQKKEIISCIKSFLGTRKKPVANSMYVFILSILFVIGKKPVYLDKMVEVIFNKDVPYNIKMYLYWQIVRIRFSEKLETVQLDLLKIYKYIFDEYKKEVNVKLKYIQPEERNRKNVVVITGQFLGELHAPTRVVLAHVNLLIKKLDYNVILINAVDQPIQMEAPFFNGWCANHVPEWNGWRDVTYKDNLFSVYQSQGSLSNLEEIRRMVQIVVDRKPFFVMNIGGSSILADLCLEYTDILNVSLSHELNITLGGLHLLSVKVDSKLKKEIEAKKLQDKVILEARCYEQQKQCGTFKRSDFGVAEDVFLIAVVGNRLDLEVDKLFLQFIEALVGELPQIEVLFIGKYLQYEESIQEYSNLKKKSNYIGIQEDLLAVYEICDLYLNPPRSGGGFSAIDALSKAMPVLTFAGGDVAEVSYHEWEMESYEDMKDIIETFIKDQKAFRKAKMKARELGDHWVDSKSLIEAIHKAEELIFKGK